MLSASNEYGILSVTMDSKPLQFYKSGIITNPNVPQLVTMQLQLGYGVDNGTIGMNSYGNNLERMVISELSGLYQVFQHVECLVVL